VREREKKRFVSGKSGRNELLVQKKTFAWQSRPITKKQGKIRKKKGLNKNKGAQSSLAWKIQKGILEKGGLEPKREDPHGYQLRGILEGGGSENKSRI